MDKDSFELQPTTPYNFDLQWKFYFSKEPQPEIYKDGIWRRAFKIGDKLVPVRVVSVEMVEKPKLKVDIFSKIDTKERAYLLEKNSRYF